MLFYVLFSILLIVFYLPYTVHVFSSTWNILHSWNVTLYIPIIVIIIILCSGCTTDIVSSDHSPVFSTFDVGLSASTVIPKGNLFVLSLKILISNSHYWTDLRKSTFSSCRPIHQIPKIIMVKKNILTHSCNVSF